MARAPVRKMPAEISLEDDEEVNLNVANDCDADPENLQTENITQK